MKHDKTSECTREKLQLKKNHVLRFYLQEFTLFPEEDLAFIQAWLKWTDENVGLLQLTRPVPSLATPGPGQADGTIMLRSSVRNTPSFEPFNSYQNDHCTKTGSGQT